MPLVACLDLEAINTEPRPHGCVQEQRSGLLGCAAATNSSTSTTTGMHTSARSGSKEGRCACAVVDVVQMVASRTTNTSIDTATWHWLAQGGLLQPQHYPAVSI